MLITSSYVDISTTDGASMRTFVAAPKREGKYPGILFYSDIFQLAGPMIRACVRLAGYGFVVAAPEIYHRIEKPGTVIGFDDIDSAAYQNPSLTTVRQPLREMGRLAAKTLLEKISRGDDSALNIRLEPELIVRESTAPLKDAAAAGSANGTRRRKS